MYIHYNTFAHVTFLQIFARCAESPGVNTYLGDSKVRAWIKQGWQKILQPAALNTSSILGIC